MTDAWIWIGIVVWLVAIVLVDGRAVDWLVGPREPRTVAREPYGTPDVLYVPAEWTRS